MRFDMSLVSTLPMLIGLLTGIEHEGQPVDTQSCMACSNKYMLTRLVRKLSQGPGGRASASRPIVNNDLDRHYALPIEMATVISKAWRSTLEATAYVDDLCSAVRRGDARTEIVPQMPLTEVPQGSGTPSDPI